MSTPTPAKLDEAILAARETFHRVRGAAAPCHAAGVVQRTTTSEGVLQNNTPPNVISTDGRKPAPDPEKTGTDPDPVFPHRAKSHREAARTVATSPRPPAHYLAGPREEWRDHVGVDGVIAPGAGRGNYWGPV